MLVKDQGSLNKSIDEIMRIWPQTISVILKNRMKCVGCPLATFHTAIDAAIEHDIDVDEFLKELNRVIEEEN